MMQSVAKPYPSADFGTPRPTLDTASAAAEWRLSQRRRAFLLQTVSYTLGAALLSLYVRSGTISAIVPLSFLAYGCALIAVFALLSELRLTDRFRDHHIVVAQVSAHNALLTIFAACAPQIGYTFLCVIFLTLSCGAIRMTSRQALTAWFITIGCVGPVLLWSQIPIGIKMDTPLERATAALMFIATIGQCAFVGLYGSSVRKKLTQNTAELKLAYSRIEELAERDELTGAFNRRCIMRQFAEEIERCRRSALPCTIALIDIDWFKRINDIYGHPAGDDVLRSFTISAFSNIRSVDRFGRYGGEEFLLIMPGADIDQGTLLMERLRIAVANLDWSAYSAQLIVTVSAGVAAVDVSESLETILSRADLALYAAKRSGRNRVCREAPQQREIA